MEKDNLYFRCGRCGARIRTFDGITYYAPLERKTLPLRRILAQREKETGSYLCDECWEKFHDRRQKCNSKGNLAAKE